MGESETVLYEVERGRARITLNRPEKRNALSFEVLGRLHDLLWDADDDRDVHAVVLRGAGPSFCAGYDMSGAGDRQRAAAAVDDAGAKAAAEPREKRRRGNKSFDDDAWQLERRQRLRMALFDMHKPVVAQVQGHCLAGGTDIALLCDMIIAADDAVFGFPPARDLGALPNNMWLYNVGPQWAKRLTLTGDTVTGAEAAKIGLVLKSVPAELLEAEVEGLLDRLALIDPDLLSANKRIINLGLELMGARTLQRLAAENDARAHLAPSFRAFGQAVQEKGLKQALRDRDEKFGDGRARVEGPEIRDSRGRLRDPGSA
jgi:enoyl-CoA hydratase